MAFPASEGHHYALNGIPEKIWQRARKRAHAEDKSVRLILISALSRYGEGLLDL